MAPGAINTRMLDEIIEAGRKAGPQNGRRRCGGKTKGARPGGGRRVYVVFLASDESDAIAGKLISALWDPWEERDFQEALRTERDLATLRRIDRRRFFVRRP